MGTPRKPRKKKDDSKLSKDVQKAPTGKNVEEQQDIPENDSQPAFLKLYELYAIWKALPPIIKGKTPRDLEEKFFIDDEQIIELAEIKTQRQFADHFGIHEKTLSRWNARLADRDLFADIRQWSNKLFKNVMMSTYRSAMSKDPKANSDRKLFMQFGGWNEEVTVHSKGESLADIIKRDLGIK